MLRPRGRLASLFGKAAGSGPRKPRKPPPSAISLAKTLRGTVAPQAGVTALLSRAGVTARQQTKPKTVATGTACAAPSSKGFVPLKRKLICPPPVSVASQPSEPIVSEPRPAKKKARGQPSRIAKSPRTEPSKYAAAERAALAALLGPVTESSAAHRRRHGSSPAARKTCPRCVYHDLGAFWSEVAQGVASRTTFLAERGIVLGGTWALGCTYCARGGGLATSGTP